jgi:asparaginyl-tRNA synthetase
MFRVTTLPPENPPRSESGHVDFKEDFFGRETNLTVSGQLEGETYALSLGEIYTFGPTFRAENSNTTRHLAEFWMIEPEMAFCDLDGDRKLAEEFLKYIIAYVLDHSESVGVLCEDEAQRAKVDEERVRFPAFLEPIRPVCPGHADQQQDE